jgi:Uncharacterized conserved protein
MKKRYKLRALLALFLVVVGGVPLIKSGTNADFNIFTADNPIHWQWQIGTPFNMSTDIINGVKVYDIDLFDTSKATVDALHALGCKVIAYASFGTYEDWRPDANQFTSNIKGRSNGWAGENWIDVRSQAVKDIMEARMNLAVSKGFDAIEPDNVDGYSNDTGFPLTAQDQLDYNEWIANTAHSKGLSVGLKNDIEQVPELEPYFDWCLNEESYKYNEYQNLSLFIGNNKAVFEVEYGTGTSQKNVMNGLQINSMTRDLDLMSPSSGGYVRLPCIPDNQDSWNGGTIITTTITTTAPTTRIPVTTKTVVPTVTTTEPNGNTIVKVLTSPESVNVGDELYAYITIKPNEAISGGMLDISFDKDVVRAEGVKEGDLFKQNGGATDFSGGVIDNDKGTIVGIGDVNAGGKSVDGVGFFAVIEFRAEGSGDCGIVVKNVVIKNSNEQNVMVSVVDCNAVVNENNGKDNENGNENGNGNGDGGIVVSPPSQGDINNSKGNGQTQTGTEGDTQVETTPNLSTSVSSLVTMFPLLIIILAVLAIVSIIATGDFQIAMIIGVVILIMVAVSFLGSVNNSINGLLGI